MGPVNTMASFMRFWSNQTAEPGAWVRLFWSALLLGVAGFMAPRPVWADSTEEPTVQNHQLALERTADSLYLSARLQVVPGPALEDALNKGIPVHFVWQAEVFQPRWYWTNKVMAQVARTVRVAYQPLTGRWRVSTAAGQPTGSGLQFALHQNHTSLSDALASAVRVSRWKLADTAALDGSGWQVAFRFALDGTLLPRPFQIGMTKPNEWDIRVVSTLPVPDALTPVVSE